MISSTGHEVPVYTVLYSIYQYIYTRGKYEYPLVGSYSHFCNLPVSDIGDQEASSVDTNTNAKKQKDISTRASKPIQAASPVV